MSKEHKRKSISYEQNTDFDSCLTSSDFQFFQDQVFQRCGISLQESKAALIESRLRKRLLVLGLNNFSEYRAFLSAQGSDCEEWQLVINGLTTHTTQWFREMDHFKELRDQIIPEWLRRSPSRPLRVWSVACSTGEEPYSIALVLNYFQAQTDLDYEITATDIDTNVLRRAKKGVYSVEDLEKIPKEYHANALAQGVGESSDLIKVRQHIKERITFSQFNLMSQPYQIGEKFDLIFCRNVLIYFSPEIIVQVANGLFEAANPGAVLLTGHSESFSNIAVPWKFIKPTYYKKPESLK